LLVDLLQRRAETTPDRVAYQFVDSAGQVEALTCADLAERARRLAWALVRQQEAMSRPGPALLLYPPGLDYVVALFACFAAGVPAVPAYPPDPWRPEVGLARLVRVVRDARPGSVLADEGLIPVLGTAAAADLAAALVQPLDEDEAGWPSPPRDGEDAVAIVQYTSGSTRSPRGVVVRHGNLRHNLAAIAKYFRLTEESRGFSWLPPYHDMGLVGGILTPVYASIPVQLMSPLDFLKNPLSWLRQISETRTTASGGPNFAYDLCLRRIGDGDLEGLDLSSWSVAFSGAEPVRWRTLDAFARKLAPAGFRPSAFFPCYGLAEATLIVSGGYWEGTVLRGTRRLRVEQLAEEDHQRADDQPPVRVSCGMGLPDQEVAIVEPDRRERLAPGVEGEIWLRGPSVTTGYWQAPADDKDAFGELDGVRFLRTGDLGYLVAGELVVTGRLKDVIVHRGVNYHAGDLEDAVVSGVAGVRPVAAAFTVDRWEASAVVVVVEARPAAGDRTEVAARVRTRALAATGLSPDIVVVAPAGTIPRTSSGKVQRSLCRQRFLAGDFAGFVGLGDETAMAVLDGDSPPTAGEAMSALVALARGVFAAACDVPECGPEDTLLEIGGDSLRAAEIAGVLEGALGLRIAVELVLDALTPAATAARLLTLWRSEHGDDRRLLDRLHDLAEKTRPTTRS
jgi:acyl-CoA synthetase (AMP-forming)/AMP-acid ligase II/acyl carrier protein